MIYEADQGLEYHIKVNEDMIGQYVIMPGDPKRCKAIAAYLEDAELVADSREFVTYTGYLDGEKVSVTSTGIGGPSAAIAMQELVHAGAHTFIRVGTCGAVADIDVVNALRESAGALGVTAHTGVVQSKDSFYGQHSPGIMPVGYELMNKWEAWKKMGCKASEMESAALLIVGAFLRVRVGACFLVVANQERAAAGLPNPEVHDTDKAIRVAIEAVKKLIRT